MFELEIRTAAFTCAAVAAVVANGLFTTWWRDRRPYLRDWTTAYAFTALGMLLVSLRGIAPDFFSIVLANLAVTYGVLRVEAGTHKLVEVPRRKHADGLVLGLLAAPFLYFYVLQPSTGARLVITSFAQCYMMLNVARLLLRSMNLATWPALLLTGVSFLCLACLQFARGVTALMGTVPDDLMRAGHLQGVLFVVTAVVLASTALGFTSIHAQRLLQQLDKVARTDDLTGLLNRRSLEETAQREVERAARSGEPVWVFMVDVDHFKAVNDRLGHQVGDQVLRSVASALHSTMRPYDVLGRYGGEEFALVLPGLGASAAVVIAERLRTAVKQQPLEGAAAGAEVSVSVGVAAVEPGETTWYGALSRADAALYQAKQGGRDRAVVHGPVSSDGTPPQPDRPTLRVIH